MDKASVKKRKFARAIIGGKTGTNAAKEVGYSAKGAHVRSSELLHDPIVQEEIARIMDKHSLGAERVAKELNRGLKQGKLGQHDSYLDKVIRIRGYIKHDQLPGPMVNVQVLQKVYNNAVEAGLI